MSRTSGHNSIFEVLLVATTALMPLGHIAGAQAQSAARSTVISFNIPSQPLTAALTAFARQTGMKIAYPAVLTSGKSAPALRGSFTNAEALNRLLAGSGLSYQFTGDNAVTIVDPRAAAAAGTGAAGGALVLDTIDVHGGADTAWGAVDGIVAQRSATGTKTDTPLLDVPASISVITADETERRGAKNLDSAVAYTSGVNTNLYGADKRYDFIAIRGFEETRHGVYRDGLQNRVGNFNGSRMEPYGMERIEVMKGSTSTLYGLNAPGGLVNMVTKRPKDYKFGEVYTTLGERHKETGIDFGGPIDADGDWSYRLTAKWQDAVDGHKWATDDRLYIAPALTWKPTDATALTLLADYNKRKGTGRYGIPLGSGIDPDTFLGEPEFDKNDTVEKNIGYVFDHDFGNGLKFHSNARYTDLTLSHEDVFAAAATPPQTGRLTMAVDGSLKRFSIDNHFQYDVSLGRFDSRTLFGFDYSRTKQNESDERGSITGVGPDLGNPVYCGRACVIPYSYKTLSWGTERTAGAYVQEELTLDDRWILTLGARYDDVKTGVAQTMVFPFFDLPFFDTEFKDHATTTRAGLTFKATDQLSLYGTYSESFQPIVDINRVATSTLKPTEGTLYEIGVKYRPEGMNALFTAALFDLTQTNVLYSISPTERGQIGEIRSRGLELEARAAVNERLNLTFAYTYLNSEIVKEGTGANNGNRMQFIPEHMASAWVDYTIPGNDTFGDLTLGLGARFVGSRYADLGNTVKISSYTVFDAALNYQITDNAALAVNVTNLFDKEYISHIETWSNPDTAFYGDRRSIKGTLKYTW